MDFLRCGQQSALHRRAVWVKRIKVGHAGTLDPLATGLLVIKRQHDQEIMHLQAAEKRYTAVVHPGEYTATLDREGGKNRPHRSHHRRAIREAAAGFVGVHASAAGVQRRMVDGKRAYKPYAAGDLDMPPVGVTMTNAMWPSTGSKSPWTSPAARVPTSAVWPVTLASGWARWPPWTTAPHPIGRLQFGRGPQPGRLPEESQELPRAPE